MITTIARFVRLAAAVIVFAAPAFGQNPSADLARDAAKAANKQMDKYFAQQPESRIITYDGRGAPPIEAFISRPALDMATLSPDGRRIVAVRREGAECYLILIDLDDPSSKAKSLRLEKMDVDWIRWGSNDRILYVAGAERPTYKGDERGVYMVGAPRLYAVGLDLRDPMMFFEKDKRVARMSFGATDIASFLPGDDQHVLMPARIGLKLDLLKVNIYDGSYETVGEGETETLQWFADRQGQPVLRFDANKRGTEIVVHVRQADASGKARWRKGQTLRIDPETKEAPEFWPVGAGPKPTQYYVRARPPGADTIGVYLYDVESGDYVEKLFSHSRADVARALLDPETGNYLGAMYWEDRFKFEFANPALRTQMDALDAYFNRSQNVIPADRARGGKRWLVYATSATSSGSFHIYEVDQQTVYEIGRTHPIMTNIKMASVFPLAYKARDGLQLSAYLTMPAKLPANGAQPPLIVMPHGGPEARDFYNYDPLVQFLASRGYAVFQPQFRGSSGYGKAFAEAGHRKWGTAMQDDITDGVKFLIQRGGADPARICIFGASYGGYAALMSAVREPELYKCAASASGPTDLVKMLKWERSEEGYDSQAYRYWVKQIGDPGEDRALVEAASPALHAAKIDDPVLLLHGENDRTVPLEQSEFMLTALKKAGKTADLVKFEMSGHGFMGRDQKKFFGELEKFFGRHLGIEPVPMLAD